MKKYICERCGKYFCRNKHLLYHINKINQCKKIINIRHRIYNDRPLRLPCGKYKNCHLIDEFIKKKIYMEKYKNVISPFFGDGHLEFYLQSNYDYNIIANNNIDLIYYFWYSVKKWNKYMVLTITDIHSKFNKKMYTYIRSCIKRITNIYMLGIFYFILNKTSYNGLINRGMSNLNNNRFTIKSIDKLKNINLSRCKLFNLKYEDFLQNKWSDENLIFLDPPNFKSVNTFNHYDLYEYIKDKENWILIYNECDYIKELYNEFIIINYFKSIIDSKRNRILIIFKKKQ